MIKQVLICSALALGVLAVENAIFPAAAHAAGPQIAATIESPCREPGHTREQACVVVNRSVVANNPTINDTLNTAVAKGVKAQNYSVIYVYRIRAGSRNSEGGIMVTRGDDIMMADISTAQPVKVWVTTRDGGRSWSKLATSDMGSAISY